MIQQELHFFLISKSTSYSFIYINSICTIKFSLVILGFFESYDKRRAYTNFRFNVNMSIVRLDDV